jgi:Ca2+-binding EF-hand superfamily protein
VKEREANTSAAAIDKRERMAFEAFLAWMVSPNVRGTLQEGAVAAFEAADAFIKAANEMRGKA